MSGYEKINKIARITRLLVEQIEQLQAIAFPSRDRLSMSLWSDRC